MMALLPRWALISRSMARPTYMGASVFRMSGRPEATLDISMTPSSISTSRSRMSENRMLVVPLPTTKTRLLVRTIVPSRLTVYSYPDGESFDLRLDRTYAGH